MTIAAPSAEVRQRLADELLATRAIAVAGHLVFLAVVLAMVGPTVPTALLIGWTGAMLALLTVRTIWSSAAPKRYLSPAVVARVVRGMVTALGLAWGVGTGLFAHYLPASTVALIVMGLSGLVAAGTTTLVADRWAFPLYLSAIFLPTVVGLILRPERPEIEEVALIVLFAGFMFRVHARAHQTLVQRLRAEATLRNSERQLASAQAIAHVGSWEWDIATNVVIRSDELRRMYGVASDAPAGYAEFLSRAHPEDRKRLESVVADTLTSKQSVDYEWRCIRPDGQMRYILGRNVVVTDARGEVVRMAGTSLDITDRKTAEENERTLLRELQASMAEVKVLTGILPICASCKRIKNETGGWEAVESFVRERTDAEFSHGLCPDCAARDWGAAPSTHRP